MRGADQPQTAMFSYLAVEDRIPADHPLRAMSALIQPILTALSPRFDGLYARMGRPSIPPERLLRALLLPLCLWAIWRSGAWSRVTAAGLAWLMVEALCALALLVAWKRLPLAPADKGVA